MSTCPIYLDECEALRVNDSIYIQKLDSSLNVMQINNYKQLQTTKQLNNLNTEQGKKITKLRWNVLKVGVVSLLSGFLAAIILL